MTFKITIIPFLVNILYFSPKKVNITVEANDSIGIVEYLVDEK